MTTTPCDQRTVHRYGLLDFGADAGKLGLRSGQVPRRRFVGISSHTSQ